MAQGYSQQEGVDYDENFASAARLESIHLLLPFSSNKGFKLLQMDVKKFVLKWFYRGRSLC